MGVGTVNIPIVLIGAQVTGSDSTGDKIIFSIPFKCNVIEAGMVIEGTEATALVVTFDKRITAGSDTGRVDAGVASITVTAANNQGKVFVNQPATAVTLTYGDQVVVEVTTASSAAKNFVPYIKLDPIPETLANATDVTVVTI